MAAVRILISDQFADGKELILQWYLARAELEFRYGYFLEAYASWLSALAHIRADSSPVSWQTLRWLDTRLQVSLAMVLRAVNSWRSVQLPEPEPNAKVSMAELLSRAIQALAEDQAQAAERLLDEARSLLSPATAPTERIDYWVLRCWQALRARSLGQFQLSLAELKQLHRETG